MSQLKAPNQSGFTIIELLIATAVFSVILLGASFALLQIGRMYYKGIVSGRTQDAARTTMDDIARPIQFAGNDIIKPQHTIIPTSAPANLQVDAYTFCVGYTRYTYALNVRVSSSASYDKAAHIGPHALWRDTVSDPTVACQPGQVDLTDKNLSGGQELLEANMRLSQLDITQPDPTNNPGLWQVDLGIIYGEDDLLTPDPNTNVPTACLGQTGDQWCAVSNLTAKVSKRIN